MNSIAVSAANIQLLDITYSVIIFADHFYWCVCVRTI